MRPSGGCPFRTASFRGLERLQGDLNSVQRPKIVARVKGGKQTVSTCDLSSTQKCDNLPSALDSNTCIKLNVNQLGFYRVSYTLTNWMCLLDSFQALPDDDRAGLVDDAFSVAYSEPSSSAVYATTMCRFRLRIGSRMKLPTQCGLQHFLTCRAFFVYSAVSLPHA